MIISSSTKKDAAIKLVDFFATPEVLQAWGGQPIRGRVPAGHAAYENPPLLNITHFVPTVSRG